MLLLLFVSFMRRPRSGRGEGKRTRGLAALHCISLRAAGCDHLLPVTVYFQLRQGVHCGGGGGRGRGCARSNAMCPGAKVLLDGLCASFSILQSTLTAGLLACSAAFLWKDVWV